VVNGRGERWELQLKGAGPTPFSRTADGRAVLRSSIREFLCSEAMHHLGVPTTRALSVVATGDQVVRDMFYDGNARPEPGAVVCRVAPSFVRFGNFELPASRGDHALLARLVDFTVARDYPHLAGVADAAERRARWLAEVCERTARMVVGWMRVGFVHGVMNTDNMSVLGLTIDYGPYGWLDDFDPHWTPNTTDAQGRRYRYAHQPAVAQWNCVRLAEAVAPLFDAEAPLQDALGRFGAVYAEEYERMVAAKFGFGPPAAPRLDEPARELAATGSGCSTRRRSTTRSSSAPSASLPDALPGGRRASSPCSATCSTTGEARRARAGARGVATPLARARGRRLRARPRRAARACTGRTRSTCCATTSRRRPSTPPRRATVARPHAARRGAPAVRRAARARALRRPPPRVGARPRGVLDAVVQLVTRRGRVFFGSRAAAPPMTSDQDRIKI
jgi:hypothetical protein